MGSQCSSLENGPACLTLLNIGPVIGKVTHDTAVVLVEVDENASLACRAVPIGRGQTVSVTKRFTGSEPGVFKLEGLQPSTVYSLEFGPLAQGQMDYIARRGCTLRTLPEPSKMTRLRLLALSCDWRPWRFTAAENPWNGVAELCKKGDVDIMLHLGDQVYTFENGCQSSAERIIGATSAASQLEVGTALPPALLHKMRQLAARKVAESYLSTWSLPATATALSNASHLMIWSDNDVTNDFTIARDEDGKQTFSPEYLRVGMRVYRAYQRQLWDPDCRIQDLEVAPRVEEWHFHTYGPCGIFFVDMRGNRIRSDGVLPDELPPILSVRQRDAIQNAFRHPDLRCMVVCAEIPFVGDDHQTCKDKCEKFPLLKDHWPYNIEELIWLLDLFFSWKSKVDGREVLLLAGDIHVSVDSLIHDNETGLSINHITTSPITNRVSKFRPALEGKLSNRYSYKHKPYPDQRTFCTIDLDFSKPAVSCETKMVCMPAQFVS